MAEEDDGKKPNEMYLHSNGEDDELDPDFKEVEDTREVEEGWERRPRKGNASHEYDSRTEREKAYVSFTDLSALVQDPRIRKRQANALNKAYDMLWKAQLIDSKAQFAAGILQMVRTPVSIAEAASICECSRQWFRELEKRGRLTIIRGSDRKTFIAASDLIKVLEGTL